MFVQSFKLSLRLTQGEEHRNYICLCTFVCVFRVFTYLFWILAAAFLEFISQEVSSFLQGYSEWWTVFPKGLINGACLV